MGKVSVDRMWSGKGCVGCGLGGLTFSVDIRIELEGNRMGALESKDPRGTTGGAGD